MAEITMGVAWLPVVWGAGGSFCLGWLWYSPKMFGTKWMQGVGLSADSMGSPSHAMAAQAIGTFLLAWVVGITETTDSILTAILIGLTIAVLIKAKGLWANKSKYAIMTETGYIIAMIVVMILAHAIL